MAAQRVTARGMEYCGAPRPMKMGNIAVALSCGSLSCASPSQTPDLLPFSAGRKGSDFPMSRSAWVGVDPSQESGLCRLSEEAGGQISAPSRLLLTHCRRCWLARRTWVLTAPQFSRP